MVDVGRVVLILALLAAAFSIVISVVSARTGSRRLLGLARNSVISIAALYTLALAVAIFAFITRDFSFAIVAEHASQDLSAIYAVSALYADKAGSILLWGWLISVFSAILAIRREEYGKGGLPYVLAIVATIQSFFLAMVTLVANVFERNPAPAADGFGLNPLLQNVAMLVHPPVLYISFAAISVVFAIVIAALINRAPGAQWTGWVRRWTLFGWCTLGLGNVIGMWWSYNELGWGGYWAWDPVENASLMPWLLMTALVHSLSVQRQRHYMQMWSLVLAIFTFAFTLLIPFITHGGIESPLHGFPDSSFPPYILGAILVALVASLGLLYSRRKDLPKETGPASMVSREGAFLTTSIILVLLTLVVLIGTVAPRVVELFGGFKIAIDRSFFDRVAGPIMLVLVFLMGVCPLLGWSRTSWQSARRNFMYSLLATLVIITGIAISGIGRWYIVIVAVCGLPVFTILLEWYRGTRARHSTRRESHIRAFFSLIKGNRSRYGGFLVHIGIVMIALGIIASSFYGIEKTATLDIGQEMEVGEYTLTYNELILTEDVARVSAIAVMSVHKNGRPVRMMYPQNDFWFSRMNTFAEAIVRTTPAEDLFVSLVWTSFTQEDKSVTIRAMVNPLVVWIWLGGGLLLSGGVIAFSAARTRPARAGE
jgi:cytochrome c-type biogenesis protein CcmF